MVQASEALNRHQRRVLEAICGFQRVHGYSPSYAELGHALGLSSLATVHKHILNLKRKGWISHEYNAGRALNILRKIPGRARIQCPNCSHQFEFAEKVG